MKPQDDTAKHIVLIVDDEPLIREWLKSLLHRLDARVQVVEAGNGREALERLADIRLGVRSGPRLIITDLKMPVMDGWELISHLKQDYENHKKPQGVPIIVLSATSGEKGLFHKESVHSGKTGYVPLVTVAKEPGKLSSKYDTVGEPGLIGWIQHFLHLPA